MERRREHGCFFDTLYHNLYHHNLVCPVICKCGRAPNVETLFSHSGCFARGAYQLCLPDEDAGLGRRPRTLAQDHGGG